MLVTAPETDAPRERREIRVLVVDDSAFMRRLVTRILECDPDIAVVGAASDGEQALDRVEHLEPDVVTLDVEMPRMNGLQFLESLMERKLLPVVMLSALTQEGAQATIRALELGAVDFVPKPSRSLSPDLGSLGDELLARVKAAARARVRRPGVWARAVGRGRRRPGDAARPALGGARAVPAVAAKPEARYLVVIGCSTGGPAALCQVLSRLPGDLPAAVAVVQHMPAGFTRSLAERLDSISGLAVREASEGDALRSAEALVAPGGVHLAFTPDARAHLDDERPPVHGVRPSVDVAMESAAQVFGPRVVGTIMTGMGCDGLAGAGALRRRGATIIAEHESSCVVYGMPRAVVEAGFADSVAPLSNLADEITRAVMALDRRYSTAPGPARPAGAGEVEAREAGAAAVP